MITIVPNYCRKTAVAFCKTLTVFVFLFIAMTTRILHGIRDHLRIIPLKLSDIPSDLDIV